MGLNLSNTQIAQELDLNVSDTQAMCRSLREMIDKEVKSAMGGILTQMKPIFVKRVQYSFDQCKFSFFNLNKKFASGKVE